MRYRSTILPALRAGLLHPFLELLKSQDLSEICDGVLSYVQWEMQLGDDREALLKKVQGVHLSV